MNGISERYRVQHTAGESYIVWGYQEGRTVAGPGTRAAMLAEFERLAAIPESLPVIFRAERAGDFKGHVTAVFPTLSWDYAGREFAVFDMEGGHGAGVLEWYRERTRAARPDEFAALERELRAIYETRPAVNPETYGPPVRLVICQRMTAAHRDALRADARRHRDAARANGGAGLPWSPDARAAAVAAIAADARESA